ncbi:MAG: hypothetical protein HY047_05930 [Acidobacteria bacterium]|nr:hypothetical protein [Acidobacteriota bacterium]
MHLPDPDLLEHIGLALYERKALMALMLCGVADAATLCREGSVPTSKIYLAMEKLGGLGLVQIQPTRRRCLRRCLRTSWSAASSRLPASGRSGLRSKPRLCMPCSRGFAHARAAGSRSSTSRLGSRAIFVDIWCRSPRRGSGFSLTWRPAISRPLMSP